MKNLIPTLLILALFAACEQREAPLDETVSWTTVQDTTGRVATATEGLAGPEAVRYDPEQDVYFVSNFNGDVDGDANGFISRVTPDGTVEEARFMTGTDEHPMHAPRGTYLTGDTLWAADADGLHAFDRTTGDHLAFVDFTEHDPGFVNDIARGPDGALYVTDTGQSRIYRVEGGKVTVALEDSLLGAPNGITWDAESERMVVVPWETQTFIAWQPGSTTLDSVATSTGGNFDGVELVDGRLLVTSQADSSLYVVEDGQSRRWIALPGRAADIGIDTQRRRVAVPYVDLNRVDIWPLPVE